MKSDRQRIITWVGALALSTSVCHAAIVDNLLLHTSFNSNDGATVKDLVAPATNGTITDTTYGKQVAAVAGDGLALGDRFSLARNVGQVADFGNVLDPGTAGYTVSGWFKPNLPNGNFWIATKADAGTSNALGWQMYLAKTDTNTNLIVRANSANAAGSRLSEQLTIANDTSWHQVAFTLTTNTTGGNTTTTIDGYFDGVDTGAWTVPAGALETITKVGATAQSISSTGTLRYGLNDGGAGAFGGLLDDFGIWNRGLSASEINSIYTAGLAGRDLENVPEPTGIAVLGLGCWALRRRRSV